MQAHGERQIPRGDPRSQDLSQPALGARPDLWVRDQVANGPLGDEAAGANDECFAVAGDSIPVLRYVGKPDGDRAVPVVHDMGAGAY